MKKALIDPRFNRIAEIRDKAFPVAAPLTWVDVPDDTTTEHKYAEGAVIAPTQDAKKPEKYAALKQRIEEALASPLLASEVKEVFLEWQNVL